VKKFVFASGGAVEEIAKTSLCLEDTHGGEIAHQLNQLVVSSLGTALARRRQKI
jgi:hypothetical protein